MSNTANNSDSFAQTDNAAAVVDLSCLLALEDVQEEGEPDLIVELIDLYLTDSLTRFISIKSAIAANEPLALKSAAHQLKGSSGNLGAFNLAQICEQLEALAVNDSCSEAAELANSLSNEYQRVTQVLLAERKARC